MIDSISTIAAIIASLTAVIISIASYYLNKNNSKVNAKKASADIVGTWVSTATRISGDNSELRVAVDKLIEENRLLRDRVSELEVNEDLLQEIETELIQIRQIYEIKIRDIESKYEAAIERIKLLEEENKRLKQLALTEKTRDGN